jgi:hypothetical protein
MFARLLRDLTFWNSTSNTSVFWGPSTGLGFHGVRELGLNLLSTTCGVSALRTAIAVGESRIVRTMRRIASSSLEFKMLLLGGILDGKE